MRRVTNMLQGLRFMDLKRYGIEYEHYIEDEDPLTFTAGDLRGAIQLPTDVIAAGLQANPRTTDDLSGNGAEHMTGQNSELNKPNTSKMYNERVY